MHIYKFTHIESGRCYIGQTIQDPYRRRLEHISGSKHTDSTYHFHNALRKYGIAAFTFDVIAEADSLEELNRLEEQYVNQFNSIENGFNIRQPGDNKIHNPKSIERMRESQRAAHARRKLLGTDGGWTRKDGGPMLGKKQSDTTKEKQRQAHLNATHCRNRTWKLIDGKRVWLDKEAAV
jgi:group I intron endonuclease